MALTAFNRSEHCILYGKYLTSFSFSEDKVKWTVTGDGYLKFRVDVNGEKNKVTVENKPGAPTASSHSELWLPVQTMSVLGHACFLPSLLSYFICDITSMISWVGNCYRERYTGFRSKTHRLTFLFSGNTSYSYV